MRDAAAFASNVASPEAPAAGVGAERRDPKMSRFAAASL